MASEAALTFVKVVTTTGSTYSEDSVNEAIREICEESVGDADIVSVTPTALPGGFLMFTIVYTVTEEGGGNSYSVKEG